MNTIRPQSVVSTSGPLPQVSVTITLPPHEGCGIVACPPDPTRGKSSDFMSLIHRLVVRHFDLSAGQSNRHRVGPSATSMGRLILNVLLSFAQFEREIISERTHNKMAATRRKGK